MRAKIWLAVIAGAGLVTACKDSGSRTIEPVNEAPNAKFSFGCAALRCDFTDTSTDDAGVSSWSWSFGDQTTSSDRHPVHSYNGAGSYSVSLTVTDTEGEISTVSHQAVATLPAVTSLSCVDASAPGGFVTCTLRLEEEAGFKVVLNSTNCEAHGNLFRVTAPVTGTLTSDGCYDQAGKELVFAAAFSAGTEISAEVVAPVLDNPPQLRVSGSYPEWVLTFEDGVDQDFDDLVMTVTALPTGN
ncbi:MAG TPA: PKD domain-containing protein [Gemmatimonadales bacterium]|nr:PKD domain-containing protein [Gemmatimonadales bacterium]